jgi:hypothetical protein
MEMMEKSIEDQLNGIQQDIDDCARLERDTTIMYQNYEVDGGVALNDLSRMLRAKLRTVHIRATVLQLHYEEPEWFASYPDDFTVHDGLFNLIPGYPNYHLLRHPPPIIRQRQEELERIQLEKIQQLKIVLATRKMEKEREKLIKHQQQRKESVRKRMRKRMKRMMTLIMNTILNQNTSGKEEGFLMSRTWSVIQMTVNRMVTAARVNWTVHQKVVPVMVNWD